MEPHEFDAMMALANRSSRRSTNRRSNKLDPNMQVIKVQFELNIRRLYLENAKDDVDFSILWMRGEKKIDTEVRQSQ